MVGAAVLYCCECRRANTTACLPSAATYSFTVTSLVRGLARRKRSPVCTVARMRLYTAIMLAARVESASENLFRLLPTPSAPCMAVRKRNPSGVLRVFILGTSVTQGDMIFAG